MVWGGGHPMEFTSESLIDITSLLDELLLSFCFFGGEGQRFPYPFVEHFFKIVIHSMQG